MNDNWNRIRRRWWFIPIAVIIALAVVIPVTSDRATTYSSKVALTTYSQNRAPEQDAILIQSYVDFFNNGADQAQLRAQAKVPDDVSFTASPVATGPIMFIVATGGDERDVRTAAAAMGGAFRDSINAGVQKTRDDAIAALRQPFLDRMARRDFILTQERVELSRQISALNADSSGRLQDLDNAITVSSDRPRALPVISVAVLIALLVGVALAWLLGGRTPRLTQKRQVEDDLGLRAFDVTARDAEGRRLQMRHLVNAMAFDDLPTPVVLAVTCVSDPAAGRLVTRELMTVRAAQGADVVVVQTISGGSEFEVGVVDVLRSPETIDLDDVLRTTEGMSGWPAGVTVLPGGRASTDPYDVMTRENIGDLLGQLRKRFSVIVIECAPITTSAEVPLLSAAADRTLLVVEKDVTSTKDGRLAASLLEQSQGEVFGAVIVSGPPRSFIDRIVGRLPLPRWASPGARGAHERGPTGDGVDRGRRDVTQPGGTHRT